MSRLQLPTNREIAAIQLENEAKMNELKVRRGWVGHVVGMGPEKLGNVGLLTFLISLVTALLVLWLVPDGAAFKRETLITLLGVVTSSLGFTFGQVVKTTSE